MPELTHRHSESTICPEAGPALPGIRHLTTPLASKLELPP